MSAVAELHKNDIGSRLIVTVKDGVVPVDLSVATVIKYKFMRKNKTTFERTGLLLTDGTDGKVQYTTVAGDLDSIGIWTLQIYFETPIWRGHSATAIFDVKDNIVIVTTP